MKVIVLIETHPNAPYVLSTVCPSISNITA